MPLIYKIAPAALWRKAQDRGRFDGAPVDIEDGFIHFSTAQQAEETALKHFSGRADLVLIAVDSRSSAKACATSHLARARCFRISTRRCRSTRSSP